MTPQEQAVIQAAKRFVEGHGYVQDIAEAVRALEPAKPKQPTYGDLVRVKCSATGRYLCDGLAIFVSAQDNEHAIDRIDLDREPAQGLPQVSDRELLAAYTGLNTRKRLIAEARAQIGGAE